MFFFDNLSDSYTVSDSITSATAGDDHSIWIGEDETDITTPTTDASNTTVKQSRLLIDAIDAASEVPNEKNSSKREAAIRRLYKALAQYSASSEENWDIIDHSSSSVIVPACRYCIDRSSSSLEEQYAACRCLEALCIMLGSNRDEHYESVEGTLRRTVMATDRVPQVRSAALRALCLTSFICCSGNLVDEQSTGLLLDFCESLCREYWRGDEEVLTPPKLRATALSCWALLSTLVDDPLISGEGDADIGRGLTMLPVLLECLEHDNFDLRFAAGECVALIHESRLSLGISDEAAENASERRYRHGSWDGTEWEALMEELKQRISDLSVQSGHQLSKKAKKEQRSVFRDLAATVIDDEAPHETISFRGGSSITLKSWKEIIQLNFIRNCLQGGFQAQLTSNVTLLNLFGVDGEAVQNTAASSLSQLEKRLILSKMSDAAKSADRTMTRQRRNRHNLKHQFLMADGDF